MCSSVLVHQAIFMSPGLGGAPWHQQYSSGGERRSTLGRRVWWLVAEIRISANLEIALLMLMALKRPELVEGEAQYLWHLMFSVNQIFLATLTNARARGRLAIKEPCLLTVFQKIVMNYWSSPS